MRSKDEIEKAEWGAMPYGKDWINVTARVREIWEMPGACASLRWLSLIETPDREKHPHYSARKTLRITFKGNPTPFEIPEDHPINPPPLPASREPLGKLASIVYEHLLGLPEHRAMTGPAILEWLAKQGHIASEDTFRDEIKPALEPYGLKNKKRIGYHIPLTDRPKIFSTIRR